MSSRQADQVAVVTGGSRGIGAAVARRLGESGYRVAVNFQSNESAATEVVASIEDRGGTAVALRADVSDHDAVGEMFATIDRELGTPTVLVNNAAISGPRCRVDELSSADLGRIIGINVAGLIVCSQHAVRRMSTSHGGVGGSIVNISSGAAHMGLPGHGVHYAMSKGAVNSFTLGLSQEVAGEGIRVNTVSPGPTRTDMMDAAGLTAAAQAIPMGRVGEPDEIADAVLWLISPASEFVAGATVRVAGGRP